MKTNDLKKYQRVMLRNGWEAELIDNMRGNTRMAKVFGKVTELGSVYSHDIMQYKGVDDTGWQHVEHTKKQLELKKTLEKIGF